MINPINGAHRTNGPQTLQIDYFAINVVLGQITYRETTMVDSDDKDELDLGEEAGFETLTIDSFFYKELGRRIRKIRKNITIKNTKTKKYKKGSLFKEDEAALEMTVSAVTDSAQAYYNGTVAKSNEDDSYTLSRSAIGLNFSVKSIKSGWYDRLIEEVLLKLAELDYLKESDSDLH